MREQQERHSESSHPQEHNQPSHQEMAAPKQKMDPEIKKLLYVGIVAVVLIAFGVILAMSGAFTKTTSAAVLEIPRADYDFGDIDISGGKVTTKYSLKNISDEPITITSAKTTCMCTEGNIGGKSFGMHSGMVGTVVIEPGETETVTGTFDPMAHGPDAVGPITRSLILQTNSTAMGEVKLNFRGNVVKNE